MVALSESDMKTLHAACPGGEITMTSYPACNKSRYLGKNALQIKKLLWNTIDTMKRYPEVLVALSESVIKNRHKRPLAKKSK